MSEFCEYIGPFGGICMRPQARETLEGELLRYCDIHLVAVRRERAKAKSYGTQQLQATTAARATSDRTSGRLHHTVRSRSEPYLLRSSSRTSDRGYSPRFAIVEGLDDSEDESGADWMRSLSSPPRLQSQHSWSAANTRSTAPASPPASDSPGRRQRVRVKRIVIPPRFEVLDEDAPATPPKVWYVRLAERVPGEPGDPADDEYIEVDMATEPRTRPAIGDDLGVSSQTSSV